MVFLFSCNSNETAISVDLNDTVEFGANKQNTSPSPDKNTFYFGFDIRATPQEDAKQYLPFLNYLSHETGYQFKLKFTPTGKSISEQLGLGMVHFASIGATSYILSNIQYDTVALVRGRNQHNKAEYQSALVIANNSSIKQLSDIKNKVFAFGSRTSTQGHLIPRIMLASNNIKLEHLKSYQYTGSHINCANAVLFGEADICGMQDTMAKEFQKKGQLRILTLSEYFPSSGIAANKDIPPEIVKNVTQALINFDPTGKHANKLYHWASTEMPNGFIKASDHDYEKLRGWMSKLKLN